VTTILSINLFFSEINYCGLGIKFLIVLSTSIPNKPMTTIYFENCFTSIRYLIFEFGILSLGTIRKHHLRRWSPKENIELMKQSKDTYETFVIISKNVNFEMFG